MYIPNRISIARFGGITREGSGFRVQGSGSRFRRFALLGSLLVAFGFTLAWTGRGLAQTSGSRDTKGTPTGAAPTAGSSVPSPAVEEIPSTLDQALAEAMERNPEIVTATAKLRLAEAELNGTRMEVARKIITIWNQRRAQEAAVESSRYVVERAQELYRKNAISLTDFESRKRALIDAESSLARIQADLRYLIGQSAPVAARSGDSAAGAAPHLTAAPLQMPRGPMVEKVRQALLKPTQLAFIDTPLQDVADYLKDFHGIEIQQDKESLGKVFPKGADIPITLNLRGISLGEAVQAIEDRYRPLRFVVRDYGIFVTTREHALEEGFYPAVEFARVSAGREAHEAQEAHQKAFDALRAEYDRQRKAGGLAAPNKPSEPVRPKEGSPLETIRDRLLQPSSSVPVPPPGSKPTRKSAVRSQPAPERRAADDPFAP